MTKVTRCAVLALLTIAAVPAMASPQGKLSSAQCLGQAIWHEARGESLATQKAVWQVIVNRSRISGKTVCQVVREKGQFPWARRLKRWKLSEEQLTGLFKVVNMKPVLSKEYLYFNRKRHSFGKQSVRIGRLWFSK